MCVCALCVYVCVCCVCVHCVCVCVVCMRCVCALYVCVCVVCVRTLCVHCVCVCMWLSIAQGGKECLSAHLISVHMHQYRTRTMASNHNSTIITDQHISFICHY